MTKINQEEMVQWIKTQCAFGARRAGSPADHQAEDFIFHTLKSFGLKNVRKEPIPILYSEAETWGLKIDGKEYQAFPIPYCHFTQCEQETEIIYVDSQKLFYDTNSWKDKVVVTKLRFPPLDASLLTKIGLGSHDPDNTVKNVNHPATWVRLGWDIYQKAAKAKAKGFIGILVDQPGGSCEMYAPYGFKEKDFLDKPIPGFWVSKKDEMDIIEKAKSNQSKATFFIQGIKKEEFTYNIVGELPGHTDETIVIGSHHDSPFVSPVEDASGVAVVLSLAKHFAASEKLQKTLVFNITASHFYGSIGTRTFIKNNQDQLLKKIIMEIHIEHIALEAKENDRMELVATGEPEPTGVFVPVNKKVIDLTLKSFQDHDLRKTILLPPEGPLGEFPPTDGGDWYEAGVPVINLISNPVYLLTSDDAFQWVDQKRLMQTSLAFKQIIEGLDRMSKEEILRKDFFFYRMIMKLLKVIIKNKTTIFGLKPVH